jgi:hypothetical protein
MTVPGPPPGERPVTGDDPPAHDWSPPPGPATWGPAPPAGWQPPPFPEPPPYRTLVPTWAWICLAVFAGLLILGAGIGLSG